ncbi:MAG TPA: hypothetical protein VF463_05605 [Sphingobium sp.]
MTARGPAWLCPLVPALFSCLLLAGLLFTAMPLGAQTPAPPMIEHVSMRLFYIYSGTLSGDIAPPASFTGWNTIIGEGDAREAAEDMLVTVRLRGTPESGHFPPVFIEAKNGKGQVVGAREATPDLTDINGRAHVAMMLHGIGCAGRLTITVRMGKAVQKSSVNLDCGE